MQIIEEVSEALVRAKVDIRQMQFIGRGHMDRKQPMKDIAVLTWPHNLPDDVPGFRRMDVMSKWWRNSDGCNIRLVTDYDEMKLWMKAADTVRALFLRGVDMTRERRIDVYRVIIDGADPSRL